MHRHGLCVRTVTAVTWMLHTARRSAESPLHSSDIAIACAQGPIASSTSRISLNPASHLQFNMLMRSFVKARVAWPSIACNRQCLRHACKCSWQWAAAPLPACRGAACYLARLTASSSHRRRHDAVIILR